MRARTPPRPRPRWLPAVAIEEERSGHLQLFRCLEVTAMCKFSKSDLYRPIRAGTFPQPHRISHRMAVWRSDEIHAWMTENAPLIPSVRQ